MTHESHTDRALSLNPVAMSCFAVAVCAIATSLLGLVIPHFPAGGMAIVGIFYLVVGLFDFVLHPAPSGQSAGQSTTEQPATSDHLHPSVTDAHNTVGDRVSAPHEGAKKALDNRRELVEV